LTKAIKNVSAYVHIEKFLGDTLLKLVQTVGLHSSAVSWELEQLAKQGLQ